MSLFVNHGNSRFLFSALRRGRRVYVSRLTLLTTNIATFTTATEEFRDIPGFSRYQVSSFGNVKIKKHNKLRFINYDRFKKLKHPPSCKLVSDCGQNKGFIISKLVLKTFDPRINDDSLCAFHVDGNKHNNHLSNLQWQTQRNINTIICQRGKVTSAVILKNETDNIEFQSARHCQQYLESINIHCSLNSIYSWSRNRARKYGFHFMYKDQKKYEPIVDIPNERWKLFYTSAKDKAYYVSSKGRIKRVTKSGKTYFVANFISGGYRSFGSACHMENQSTLIHRAVADAFVSNPNEYGMVDHIDGDSLNNAAENLRWVANQKENYTNPVSRERPQNKREIVQMSLMDDTVIEIWDRAFCVQVKQGWRTSNILAACRAERKSAYGYKWRFLDEMNVNSI